MSEYSFSFFSLGATVIDPHRDAFWSRTSGKNTPFPIPSGACSRTTSKKAACNF